MHFTKHNNYSMITNSSMTHVRNVSNNLHNTLVMEIKYDGMPLCWKYGQHTISEIICTLNLKLICNLIRKWNTRYTLVPCTIEIGRNNRSTDDLNIITIRFYHTHRYVFFSTWKPLYSKVIQLNINMAKMWRIWYYAQQIRLTPFNLIGLPPYRCSMVV